LLPGACFALVFRRRWRYRYRHWEHRPRFWSKYGREHARSARIGTVLHRVVQAMDRHRCVACKVRLPQGGHVDHYLPWSRGGLTWLPNLMLLCPHCNLTKSNAWWTGYYRPIEDDYGRPVKEYNNHSEAIAILSAQRRARMNPLRWWRAAWMLG
jgi:5-methylcytosine-specific restriction endonuclease McrA